mgnify:CR=1 FL=1
MGKSDDNSNYKITPLGLELDIYGAVAFSSTAYWGEVDDGTFIYDDRASISTYVNAYKSTLTGMGVSEDIVVTLPSAQQLEDSRIGCSYDSSMYEGICTGPSWVYMTSYWTGSAYLDTPTIGLYVDYYVYNVYSDGNYGGYDFYYDGLYGVRPIVIISESDIGVS